MAVGGLVLALWACASAPGPTPPPDPEPPLPPTGLLAFPGAEGFGAQASGGRGGRVIYVTNLNLTGPGSLQAALDQEGARTIVFAVSGVINGPVQLTRGNVTVAGQTSPGGVTVRGLIIQGDVVCEDDTANCVPQVAPENFVVRFLRSRDPAEAVDPWAVAGGDTLRLHRAKKGIIDHLSLGNAYDEAVQISFSSDITLQNTLLAETLGGHSPLGGMLINYSDPTRGFPLTRLSLHHNVWHRIEGRLPEMSRENYPSSRNSVMDIEISQNLFYDPAAAIWLGLSCDPSNTTYLGCPIDYRLNMENNLFVGRPGRFSYGMLTLEGGLQPAEGYRPSSSGTRVYMRGNRINLFPTVTDYQLIYCCNDFDQAVRDLGMPYPDPARPPSFAQASRHPFPEISPVANLVDHAVRQVGMFPRDPMDARLMGYIASQQSGPDPTNENPAGDALRPVANLPALPTDSDLDGMPNSWETAHGLNPDQYGPNDTDLSNDPANEIQGCTVGYTNLECYLNELAAQRVAGR